MGGSALWRLIRWIEPVAVLQGADNGLTTEDSPVVDDLRFFGLSYRVRSGFY